MADTQEMMNEKFNAEISKLLAETAKISAETSRLNQEHSTYPWMPLVIAIIPAILGSTGVIGAIIALVIAYHK